MQRLGRVNPLEEAHGENTDEGKDQTDHGHHQRQDHGVGLNRSTATQLEQQLRTGGRGNRHGGNDRTDIGLEDISSHTGGVTDTVADVVSDNPRVARVIFRNTGFDLTDQVGTDVRSLGVDTAADTGKQCNGGSTHGKTIDVFRCFRTTAKIDISNTDADQTEGSNRQAHDGTAVIGNLQSLGLTVSTSSFTGPHIGTGRRLHADITASHGTNSAADKSQCGLIVHTDQNQDENHRNKNGQHPVLTTEESHGATINIVGNLTHFLVSDRLCLNNLVDHNRDCETDYSQNRSPHLQFHLFLASLLSV